MTDQQLIEALIARDEKITLQFFFKDCRMNMNIARYLLLEPLFDRILLRFVFFGILNFFISFSY